MIFDIVLKIGWRFRVLIGYLIVLRYYDVNVKRLLDMKNCDIGCLFFFILRR